MSNWESSRQFLQKESGDGVSLYSHLADTLLKVGAVLSEYEIYVYTIFSCR